MTSSVVSTERARWRKTVPMLHARLDLSRRKIDVCLGSRRLLLCDVAEPVRMSPPWDRRHSTEANAVVGADGELSGSA